MNIIIVSGRLGADVREYTTPSGKTVVHFPLAVRKSLRKMSVENIRSITSRLKYGVQ